MKKLLLLFLLFIGCGKEELPTYDIRIDVEGYVYDLKVESTNGLGKLYLNEKGIKNIHTFYIRPINNEDVTLEYTCVSYLGLHIYIDGKQTIAQIQPEGTGKFYLKKL